MAPLPLPGSPLEVHVLLLLLGRSKEVVFHGALCGLWISSGAGQEFLKQTALANICLNVTFLLFIFRLHVECGKPHFNPNSDKGDGSAIQHFNITFFFLRTTLFITEDCK